MKIRYQASGYRHQGSGYGACVALAVMRSSGEVPVLGASGPAVTSAAANGAGYLKPDTFLET